LHQRLNGWPPHQIARLGIARTFQNIRLFKEMSVLENVLVALGSHHRYGPAGALLSLSSYRDAERNDRDTALRLLAKMALAEKYDQSAGTLPYGEQRRLEIARALATKPRLILLDEPAAGMNTVEKQQLTDEIVKLNAEGITIMIIDHDMGVIMSLCHEIAVLNFGKVIARGRPDEIRNDALVVEAYLGREEGNILEREEPL
jgi:branched-chain amino acid transport system ATP-binding protein